MKLILFLSLIYIVTEFFDYICAVIVHMVKGDYKSHIAKIGALKKLGVTAIVVFLPTICQIIKIGGTYFDYNIPNEILGFSYLFIIKQIITEITSINETLQLIKGDNTDDKKA